MTQANITYQTEIIDKCPGCGKPIVARVSAVLDIENAIIDQENNRVDATGSIQGIQINHDCIPQTPRSLG